MSYRYAFALAVALAACETGGTIVIETFDGAGGASSGLSGNGGAAGQINVSTGSGGNGGDMPLPTPDAGGCQLPNGRGGSELRYC